MTFRFMTMAIFSSVLGTANFAAAFDVPLFRPNVVDQTNTLQPSEIGQLNSEIQKIRNESHVFAAILMVNTLEGDSVEAAAEKTFRLWELGTKGTDNGLLILVALKDRRMRIEVGYGLEGAIPDIRAKEIVSSVLVPRFREKQYFEGLTQALAAANLVVLKDGPRTSVSGHQVPVRYRYGDLLQNAILWIFLILVPPIFLRLFALSRARRYAPELQPTQKESAVLRVLRGPGTILPLFLIFVPGAFFLFLRKPELFWTPICITLFAYLFLLLRNRSYLQMLNEKWRRSEFVKLNRKFPFPIGDPKLAVWDLVGFETFHSVAWSIGSPGNASQEASGGLSSSSNSGSPTSGGASSDGGSSGGGGASDSW